MEIIKRDGKKYINYDWVEKTREKAGFGLPIGYDEYIYKLFPDQEKNPEMS